MGLFQTRFAQRITKPLGFWFTAPQRIQGVILIDETAGIGLARLPLRTGYIYSEKTKRAWASIYKLTFRVEGMEGRYLLISERSYIPLDPLGRLSPEERESLAAIENIADTEHDRAWAELNKGGAQSDNYKFLNRTIIICGILNILFIALRYFKGG